MTSTAAAWLRTEKTFKTYDELKSALAKEFVDSVSTKQIHELMSTRKKRKEESCYDYVLEMKALGKRGKLADYVAIQYIIEGIIDHESNKIMLYGANTYSELKDKLKLYETYKQNLKNNASTSGSTTSNRNIRHSKQAVRCFSCGRMNHTSNDCPHRDKGLKCFRCNEFGHIGSQCSDIHRGAGGGSVGGSTSATTMRPIRSAKQFEYGHTSRTYEQKPNGTTSSIKQLCAKLTKDDSRLSRSISERPFANDIANVSQNVNVNCKQDFVDNVNVNKSVKLVKICGKNVTSLIDSGSDLNLVSEKLFFDLDVTTFVKENVTLTGLGEKRVNSLGNFQTSVELDGQYFKTTFHIVPHVAMPNDLLLGQEFLSNAVIMINRGSVMVMPQNDDLWLNKICCSVSGSGGPNCLVTDLRIKQEVEQLVSDYIPAKSKEAPIEMKIILTDDVPVTQRPRRLALMEQREVDKQIGEWLDNKIIRPSFSEYASLLVLVKKKDGSYRVCVDYRRINKKMVKDEFPLPIIEDHIDKLAEARVFTKLDLKNAFFHLNVSEESVKYTSFVTHAGQFEFLKAPFGLSICPKYFTRYINIIFSDLIRKGYLLIFIDDLLIMSKDYDEGLMKLREVLKVASEYGLEINWKKCELLTTCVDYLGHTIENGTVRSSVDKIDAVMNFPEPKTLKQLHSFIGLSSYFRKYIKDFAAIASPLTNLLKKNQTFQFTEDEKEAFNILKHRLCNQSVLKIYHPDLPTELHIDASLHAHSAIHMQRSPDDGELHPVYYSSSKTTDSEKKYTSYELEALAVLEGVKKFRKYLLGIPFKIVTDCAAFEMTLRKKDLATRVARWALLLQDYDYTVEHRSGSKMRHVDALSRSAQFTGVITRQMHDQIKIAQENDDGLKAIKDILKYGSYSDYFIENDLLYKTEQRLLVIPKAMETEIIRRVHGIGHFGKRKMIDLVKKDYFIKDVNKKIEDFIVTCIPCILATKKEGKQEGFLNPMEKEDVPLHTIHIDHIGPMTETKKQYNYLLTIVDAFTKFVWIFPTKSTTSKEAIDKLQIHQQHFGNPNRIISDRGTAFTSHEFEQYCEEEDVQHIKITTGVPRGNGQVERIHRTIISILTKLCIETPDLWYKHVSRVQRCLNSTYQRSINCTPYELMIGNRMRIKEDLEVYSLLVQEERDIFTDKREKLRQEAKEQILKVQEENNKFQQKKEREYQAQAR